MSSQPSRSYSNKTQTDLPRLTSDTVTPFSQSEELPEEIPDSQPEPQSSTSADHEELDFDIESTASAQILQDTVIIKGGTKLSPSLGKNTSLRERGFHTRGRLPTENRHHVYKNSMDEEATQPATQPVLGSHHLGKNKSISHEDECDVICILHPTSIAAHKLIETVAKNSPQHILQNNNIERNLDKENSFHAGKPPVPLATSLQVRDDSTRDDFNSRDTVPHDDDLAPPTPHRSLDIALRISSKILDPCLGFTFGRNSKKCDIVFDTESDRRVSMRHFRIYLNENGIIMLQDMSTNGTFVDETLLLGDPKSGFHKSHMLQHGSTIELITTGAEGNIKFITSIPSRDHAGGKWETRLRDYIDFLAQATRQAEAVREAKKAGNDLAVPVVPVNPLRDAIPPRSDIVAKNSGFARLSSGSERYHFGMHWNGGETYNVVAYLGKGAFANVYKLATKSEGRVFAVKELEKRNFIKNGTAKFKVQSELDIMKSMRHPHIIEYVGYHDTTRHLYIVMEYSSGGDLSQYMNTVGMMPERYCQSIAHQLCHALNYLHQCGITHRDIKPENLLLSCHDPLMVKLSDFGLSKWIKKDEDTNLKTFCGTLLYCAPEVYPEYERVKKGLPRKRRRPSEPVSTPLPYSSAVDAWSLGAVLFHLLCTKPPYAGSSEDRGGLMLETIMTTKLSLDPLLQAGTSRDGVDFLVRLLNVNPEKRATAAQSLRHNWINHMNDAPSTHLPPMTNTQNVSGLANIEEGEEDLDASRLSLHEPHPTETNESGEDEESFEVDEIIGGHQSKRFKSTHDESLQELRTFTAIDALRYPTLPMVGQNIQVPLQHQSPTRLFGEITSSALRSSGVFGYNAQTALQIPIEGSGVAESEGSHRVTESEGSYDHSDNMTEVFNDQHVTSEDIKQHHLQHLRKVSHPHPALSAPSLFGAEAQIGQLNMASPESGASIPSIATAPVSPHSRQASPVTTLIRSGSKHPSQTDDVTHKLADTDQATNTSKSSSFAKPNPIFGKLTSIPESSIKLTIKLKQRVTSFGRDTRNTDVWPHAQDQRIPRIAFRIVFWRPGIERDVNSKGLDWLSVPENEICTIIKTETSKCIWVNDVVLTKGNDGAWFYGNLMNGDIITVFREQGDVVAFKCEFFHGTAKEDRGKGRGNRFEVKKEVENFMREKVRRSSAGQEQRGTTGELKMVANSNVGEKAIEATTSGKASDGRTSRKASVSNNEGKASQGPSQEKMVGNRGVVKGTGATAKS